MIQWQTEKQHKNEKEIETEENKVKENAPHPPLSLISPPQKTSQSSCPLEQHKHRGLGKFSLDIPVLLKSHTTGSTSSIKPCVYTGTKLKINIWNKRLCCETISFSQQNPNINQPLTLSGKKAITKKLHGVLPNVWWSVIILQLWVWSGQITDPFKSFVKGLY